MLFTLPFICVAFKKNKPIEFMCLGMPNKPACNFATCAVNLTVNLCMVNEYVIVYIGGSIWWIHPTEHDAYGYFEKHGNYNVCWTWL